MSSITGRTSFQKDGCATVLYYSKPFVEEDIDDFEPLTEAQILKEQRSLMGLCDDSDDESLYNDDEDDDNNEDSRKLTPTCSSEDMQEPEDTNNSSAEPNSPTCVIHMGIISMSTASKNDKVTTYLQHDNDQELFIEEDLTDKFPRKLEQTYLDAESPKEKESECLHLSHPQILSAKSNEKNSGTGYKTHTSPENLNIVTVAYIEQQNIFDRGPEVSTVADVLHAPDSGYANDIIHEVLRMHTKDSSSPLDTPPRRQSGKITTKENTSLDVDSLQPSFNTVRQEPTVDDDALQAETSIVNVRNLEPRHEDDLESVEEYLGQQIETAKPYVEHEDFESLLAQFHELTDNGDCLIVRPSCNNEDEESYAQPGEVEGEVEAMQSKSQQTILRIKQMEFIGARVHLDRGMDDSDTLSIGETREELGNAHQQKNADEQQQVEGIFDSHIDKALWSVEEPTAITDEFMVQNAKLEALEVRNEMAAAEIEELKYKLSEMQVMIDDLEQERNYNVAKVSELSELLGIESEEDACAKLILKSEQVSALVVEVERLREAVKRSDAQIDALQQERDANRRMVVELSDIFRLTEEKSPDRDDCTDDYTKRLKGGDILTREQALELTILSLRNKVETLGGEKFDFLCTIDSLRDEVMTFLCEKEEHLTQIRVLQNRLFLLEQRQGNMADASDTEGPYGMGDKGVTPTKVSANRKKFCGWG